MTNDAGDLAFGDFRIDRTDERLIGPAGPVRLGHKAWQVLIRLIEQDGRLLTKDALFASVWDGTIVSESALTSVIKELRRALGDESRTPRYIESVYGRGYRWLAQVERVREASQLPPAQARQDEGTRGTAGLGRPPLLYIPAFEEMASADSPKHFAAVVREEILFALSRFRDIRLVSSAATAAADQGGYGERDYQLSVRLVDAGGSVRAFARLTNLSTGAIIWADGVELGEGSLGPDVDKLVRRIAAAALPRLHDDLLRHVPDRPQDAYDLYFLTKVRMRNLTTFAEGREVAEAWERFIEQHPGFAAAYPPLTRLYNTDYCFSGLGATGEAERRRAYDLAHRAFALDPTESHLHTVKGWSHLWAGEAALAREHLQEALQLNPYHQSRLVEVATAFMYLDDLDRAADLLERCRALTPFATEAPHEEQGLLHLLRGEFDAAAQELTLVRRHHPDDPAGTRPTVQGELYALLAAAGRGSVDLAERAGRWRAAVIERWWTTERPDEERLKQWVLYHSPFQEAGRRAWLSGLLDRALAAAPLAPAPGRRGTQSAPSPGVAGRPACPSVPR
ncbi:MAG TPA: winged helix-turn-helix domain-containing protein [Allosphingosinicella sp.]